MRTRPSSSQGAAPANCFCFLKKALKMAKLLLFCVLVDREQGEEASRLLALRHAIKKSSI